MAVDRVVIIGASAAGLFAAAAAAGAGKAVTVLERDELPEQPRARAGVPQGQQIHVFLYRGLLAAEELLPGLRQDLLDAGAVPFDTSDLAWLGEQGWAPRNVKTFQVFSTTRPLLEATIRHRVAALPPVEIRTNSKVTGLQRHGTGWTVELSDENVPGRGSVDADLVIDASGRNSRLSHWIADQFADDVRTSEIDAKLGYATRLYEGDAAIGNIPGMVISSSPGDPRGGLAIPVENGRWLLTAVGFGERRPPRDVEGYEAFLAGLPDPGLSALARRLTPVSEVSVHRQTGNRRRHYEDRRDWPDGLLVIGDAFCAFNPVYGQGISVAACEAVLVRDALEVGLKPGGARRLLREFAKVTALPWSVATSSDLSYSTCEQSPTRLAVLSNKWAFALGTLSAHGNARAAATLGGVYHLMLPSRQLLHPALIWASVVGHFRGYGPANQRPVGLPDLTLQE